MTAKIRKQLYIDPEQDATLKRLSGELQVSEAELVRRALRSHALQLPGGRREPKAWERERRFLAQLKNAGPVAGGRTWTREEIYDL
jgi:hypothetical protein